MITNLVPALLVVAGFLTALGALLAILDRIETALYDAVATWPDSPPVQHDAPRDDDPVGLPEQGRQHAGIAEDPELGVATHLPG